MILLLHWPSSVSSFSDLLQRGDFNGLICLGHLVSNRTWFIWGTLLLLTRVPSAWLPVALIHWFLDRQLVTQGTLSLVKTFTLCFWCTNQLSQNWNIDPAATIHHPSAQGCSLECSNHSFNHFYFIKKTPVPNLGTRCREGWQKYLMKQMIISGNEHEVWR